MAIISSRIWALCPVWRLLPLVPQRMKHLAQQGSQATNQRRVGEDFQECTKERDQTHIFLSLQWDDTRTEVSPLGSGCQSLVEQLVKNVRRCISTYSQISKVISSDHEQRDSRKPAERNPHFSTQ